MKISVLLLASALTLMALGGCASLDSKLAHEFEKIRRGPSGAPYKSISNFSEALTCVDKLMLTKGIHGIPIMVEDIGDKTEEVKTGTRDMLISAISRMTTQSKAIKLIAYGKDSGNLVSFMKAANYTDGYKQMPLYDIQGSISQFDKGVASVDSSAGLFYRKKGGAGAAHSASLNVVAMDLNVLRAADMSVVSGVTSSNSVAIFQRGDSLDLDASINKLGIYFDLSLNASEGQAQAVRNLVDLAAIETIGKLVGVPYGNCLGVQDNAASGETQAPAAQPAQPKPVIAKIPKLVPKQTAAVKVMPAVMATKTPDAKQIVRVKRIIASEVIK